MGCFLREVACVEKHRQDNEYQLLFQELLKRKTTFAKPLHLLFWDAAYSVWSIQPTLTKFKKGEGNSCTASWLDYH